MDGDRVGSLVEGLTSTCGAAFNFYTKWKQKQEQENHYEGHTIKRSPAVSKCGLGASLDISSSRIKSAYDVGFAIIGPEFFVGDAICRDCLWANLTRLHERVNLFRLAILSARREPFNLHELIRVSEATRHNCVDALAQQYKRLGSGRLVPPDLPIPSLRPSLRPQPRLQDHQERAAKDPIPRHDSQPVDFDRQAEVWSTSSSPTVFKSEPPSPPPTPLAAANTQAPPPGRGSPLSGASNPRIAAGGRPNNSVFTIFCPEAMALQVDPGRPAPSAGTCKCGYRWDGGTSLGEDGSVMLKEGFRMAKRFLAKSHCDRTAGEDEGEGEGRRRYAYGCVLCTSSGRAETFGSVEMLTAHVNAAHTKWQMLHDRDLA